MKFVLTKDKHIGKLTTKPDKKTILREALIIIKKIQSLHTSNNIKERDVLIAELLSYDIGVDLPDMYLEMAINGGDVKDHVRIERERLKYVSDKKIECFKEFEKLLE
ncbi:hypothetical protein COBT_001279 [Conglomerata obtusa]